MLVSLIIILVVLFIILQRNDVIQVGGSGRIPTYFVHHRKGKDALIFDKRGKVYAREKMSKKKYEKVLEVSKSDNSPVKLIEVKKSKDLPKKFNMKGALSFDEFGRKLYKESLENMQIVGPQMEDEDERKEKKSRKGKKDRKDEDEDDSDEDEERKGRKGRKGKKGEDEDDSDEDEERKGRKGRKGRKDRKGKKNEDEEREERKGRKGRKDEDEDRKDRKGRKERKGKKDRKGKKGRKTMRQRVDTLPTDVIDSYPAKQIVDDIEDLHAKVPKEKPEKVVRKAKKLAKELRGEDKQLYSDLKNIKKSTVANDETERILNLEARVYALAEEVSRGHAMLVDIRNQLTSMPEVDTSELTDLDIELVKKPKCPVCPIPAINNPVSVSEVTNQGFGSLTMRGWEN